MQLDAEAIEAEVEDYGRELYKIQKVFNNRLKKLLAEKEERERERKKKRRMDDEEEGGAKEEDQEDDIKPPAALDICNKTMVRQNPPRTHFPFNSFLLKPLLPI